MLIPQRSCETEMKPIQHVDRAHVQYIGLLARLQNSGQPAQVTPNDVTKDIRASTRQHGADVDRKG